MFLHALVVIPLTSHPLAPIEHPPNNNMQSFAKNHENSNHTFIHIKHAPKNRSRCKARPLGPWAFCCGDQRHHTIYSSQRTLRRLAQPRSGSCIFGSCSKRKKIAKKKKCFPPVQPRIPALIQASKRKSTRNSNKDEVRPICSVLARKIDQTPTSNSKKRQVELQTCTCSGFCSGSRFAHTRRYASRAVDSSPSNRR